MRRSTSKRGKRRKLKQILQRVTMKRPPKWKLLLLLLLLLSVEQRVHVASSEDVSGGCLSHESTHENKDDKVWTVGPRNGQPTHISAWYSHLQPHIRSRYGMGETKKVNTAACMRSMNGGVVPPLPGGIIALLS